QPRSTASPTLFPYTTLFRSTNLGSVRICKNAGTGINVGDQFTFTVTVGNDAPFDVNVSAGGLCQTVNNIVDGTNVHVAEQPSTSDRKVTRPNSTHLATMDLA